MNTVELFKLKPSLSTSEVDITPTLQLVYTNNAQSQTDSGTYKCALTNYKIYGWEVKVSLAAQWQIQIFQ